MLIPIKQSWIIKLLFVCVCVYLTMWIKMLPATVANSIFNN